MTSIFNRTGYVIGIALFFPTAAFAAYDLRIAPAKSVASAFMSIAEPLNLNGIEGGKAAWTPDIDAVSRPDAMPRSRLRPSLAGRSGSASFGPGGGGKPTFGASGGGGGNWHHAHMGPIGGGSKPISGGGGKPILSGSGGGASHPAGIGPVGNGRKPSVGGGRRPAAVGRKPASSR